MKKLVDNPPSQKYVNLKILFHGEFTESFSFLKKEKSGDDNIEVKIVGGSRNS